MDYPTAAQLSAMGATLTRDVDLWNDRLKREYAAGYHRVLRTMARPDPPMERDKPQRRAHRSTRLAGRRIV